MTHYPVVITGAGPAGLTAAYELAKNGIQPVVLEKANMVGGISRTEAYKGYRFDIGGHRFFTKVEPVQALWKEVLEDQFIKVPRLSRIYYQGKFYNYPLSMFNALSNLGVVRSFLILVSYLKAKIRARLQPNRKFETFEDWVIDRFGYQLYRTFFKTYTEKVWGIPCSKIQADWAAQRIKQLSLKQAVINAVFRTNKKEASTLITEFDYPRLGPGMMWEAFQAKVEEKGGKVCLNTNVVCVERDGTKVQSIIIEQDGETRQITGDHFVSSMPVTALVHRLNPPAPAEVLEAADSLSYRDFLIVALVIDIKEMFPDNWIYIHSPGVQVGRIQNFKNWSPEMVPDPTKTCLGMEYFCNDGDELWAMPDEALIDLAGQELRQLGFAKSATVEDGTVIRQYKAYPVYDRDYRKHLSVIQGFIETFDNLQTVGRNGMHRYNNQDHSMLTAVMAARNILGEDYDLWSVNTERSYHEEFTKEDLRRNKDNQDPGFSLAST